MSASVLIVPDDLERDHGLTAILDTVGCQVSIAESAQDALYKLESEPFDLVILNEYVTNYGTGYDLLAELRLQTRQVANVLTLMLTARNGYEGIVRTPAYPNQAHAYLPVPFLPDDICQVVTRLLAGASMQLMPGDEGYVHFEHRELAVRFEYPALWQSYHDLVLRSTEAYHCASLSVVGPLNRYQSIPSLIKVALYRLLDPGHRLGAKDWLLELGEVVRSRRVHSRSSNVMDLSRLEDMQRVSPEREIDLTGLQGLEAEYVFPAEYTRTYQRSRWRQPGERVKTIGAAVNRSDVTYLLRLSTAEEEFEYFRPAYAHLVETFQFLDNQKQAVF